MSASPPDAAPPAIRIAGLVKEYRSWLGRRRVRALDGITFHVPRGEVVGLLGPNGGGKTTTLKCLLGFLRPTAGEVEVLGRPPTDLAARARLGFLPEESPFPGFLRLEAGLDFFGALARVPRRERRERIPRLLERVGLADARRRRLDELSKGMARRFGIAQALIGEPELLILDEPTSGLDPLGMRDFGRLLAELRAAGLTVLLSSHQLGQVETVCDRAAVLHRGKLLAFDPVPAIVAASGEKTLEAAFLRLVA